MTGPFTPSAAAEEDLDFLRSAIAALEDATFDDAIWQSLTGILKEETGRKGKPLFLPLRRALTGLDHGPDMTQLLPLIGKQQALARLNGALTQF